MVLPFFDQVPLFQELAPDGGNAPTIPTTLTKKVLPFYLCPSDASVAWNQQKGGHAKSNYVGMFGSNKDQSDIGNGMFYFNSSTRTSDLTDYFYTTCKASPGAKDRICSLKPASDCSRDNQCVPHDDYSASSDCTRTHGTSASSSKTSRPALRPSQVQ